MDNPEANKANWTIKDFPVTTRKVAVDCAKRLDLSVAAWLAGAVRNQASHDDGALVLPPDQRPTETANRDPAAPDPFARLAALASAGLPVPRDVRGHAFAILRDQLRAARGLPPVMRRARGDRLALTANHGQPDG